MSMKVFIEKPYYTDSTRITFVKYQGDKVFVAKPVELVFEEVDKYALRGDPTLEIDRWHSEELLEALKKAIERKPVGTVEGELKATKEHLKDMKRLVFRRR